VRARLGPDIALALGANVLKGGGALGPQGRDIELGVTREPDVEDIGPYEHLLTEAMSGNALLFNRVDGVEAAWRGVEPILGTATPAVEYEPGTWGPREADDLIAAHGGWNNPEVG
jgi:glucose-6-phosphate 1-dehydrogenase